MLSLPKAPPENLATTPIMQRIAETGGQPLPGGVDVGLPPGRAAARLRDAGVEVAAEAACDHVLAGQLVPDGVDERARRRRRQRNL